MTDSLITCYAHFILKTLGKQKRLKYDENIVSLVNHLQKCRSNHPLKDFSLYYFLSLLLLVLLRAKQHSCVHWSTYFIHLCIKSFNVSQDINEIDRPTIYLHVTYFSKFFGCGQKYVSLSLSGNINQHNKAEIMVYIWQLLMHK